MRISRILPVLLATSAPAAKAESPALPAPPPPAPSELVDEPKAPTPKPVAGEVTHQDFTGEGLKVDPRLVYGKLENGLRFAILPNQEPPDRTSARLYLNTGSLMETDAQQGLAHFLEHMAFNGTKHFPAGEMIEFFQRLGMAFGADTNAHTSFKETVYKLELPQSKPEQIDQAMLYFRDLLTDMNLEEKEIDAERGIILSEKLSRDSVAYRMRIEGYKFSLPEALLTRRLPIGEEEVIKTAPRSEFSDYYKKWYTPDRAFLIFVGNVDPKEIEAKIRAQFADVPANEPVPDPDFGKVTTGAGLRARLHTESELPAVTIAIETSRPSSHTPDSATDRTRDLIRGLSDRILNRRFEILSKQENSPILSAGAGTSDFLDFVYSTGIDASCKPEKWREALGLIEQEIRKAREFGFTDSEVAAVKAEALNYYENTARSASTRKSSNLADELVDIVAEREVFTTPEDDLALAKAALSDASVVNPETIHALFKADWDSKDLSIFIGGNLKLDDAENAIKTAWTESSAQPVTAPEATQDIPFAYTEFGTPGKIVSETKADDLAITQVKFANGVVVNLKPTDFQKNQINVQVNIGGGKLDSLPGQEELNFYADNIFIASGLEKHSSDDLELLLAGKTVSRSFQVADDAFSLSGSTEPDDLQLQLQLLCAYATAPGYRPEADRLLKSALDAMYGQIDHTMEGVIRAKMPAMIRSGDKRFGFPEREALEKATPERLREYLTPVLQNGFTEINITGDFDPAEALKAVAATFGALPERQTEKPPYTEQRKLAWNSQKDGIKLTFTTKVPKALVAVAWPTEDLWDIKRSRRLGILGEILDERLRVKIREELGDSYSPFAYHVPSDTFTGFGMMSAMVIINPDQIDEVKSALDEIRDELLSKDISEDEMQRVIGPQINRLKQQLRDNSYWQNTVLRGSPQHPEKLQWARDLLEDVSSIKAEELKPLIQKYLTKDTETLIEVTPLPWEEKDAP